MREAVFFLFFVFSLPAFADNHTKDDWPVGSAVHTMYLMYEQDQTLSGHLDARYSEFIDFLHEKEAGERIIQDVEAIQESWLSHTLSQCSLYGTLTGAGGKWPDVWAIDCMIHLKKDRINKITNVTACIEKSKEMDYFAERMECLRPLLEIDESWSIKG